MKKLVVGLILGLALLGSSCESSTELGACIGVFDEEREGLLYSISGRNVGVAIAAFVIPPIGLVTTAVVLVDQLKCPVDAGVRR